ncbi:MAG: dCMP deaminase family protein [Mesorhizobium sp.]|uniref:deoxycytidylate deaminase n=1 Tax=Mesorhizobium sp. TaxID=1871066 RepID=UPI000FE653C5|nr:dCMP deaminase family protein [Mesorhizobium sp.]RWB40495.1 MAG: dCMP deaminase family protein [Mesorhizobium sp.]
MDWRSYYYGFARHAALKSKDSTQVGAVLVGPEGEIRLTGYNGPPRGVEDKPSRQQRPTKYLFASHAEANMIAFAAREGIRTKDCTVYVTHSPCAACARTLIQAGIKEVVIGTGAFASAATWSEENHAAADMFMEAGVQVTNFHCQEFA